MLDFLKSLWKRKHVVSVPHILLVETLPPKIFMENTVKNTENQRPTSKINFPLGVKFYSYLNTLLLLTIGVFQTYNPIFTAYTDY